MRFTKEELINKVELGGRVFLFEMPARKENKNAVYTLEDDINFADLILSNEHFNAKGVDRVQVNGIIPITFGNTEATDEEIIEFIADCASKCTFE